MIYIQSMGGGLGNQLFVYAAARALQLETGEPIVVYDDPYDGKISHATRIVEQMIPAEVDIDYIEKEDGKQLFYKQLFPIRTLIFRISHRIYRTVFCVKNPMQRYRMETVMQPFWNRLGFGAVTLGYIPIHRYKHPRDYVMLGYFCSRHFYGSHVETIRKELCRPDLISERSQELLRKIRTCNSVCVHIRLGDYVDPTLQFRELFYVCGLKYYESAIQQACNDLEAPIFFVFTNDLKTASEFHFWEGLNVIFIPDGHTAVEDLQLMAQCKHYILSNSTYSWWGQFLCGNKEKHVYAPNRWFRSAMPEDYNESEWIQIDTPLPEI